MAATSTPYGLKPINLIGGQSFNGGVIRQFVLSTNNAGAFYTGDVIQLSSAGNPQALGSTPTAGTTAGIVGVCLGVSYVDPNLKYQVFAQYLPANAITGGYTNVTIHVCDDPDQLYQVQGSAAFGTLTNGANGAVGKNAALGNFGGNATTGLSTINVVVGANGGSLASTNTLAVRIVDVVDASANDAYPDLIVKFNQGVHSYLFSTGV
ncbi:MAG: hypothetical protein FGM53_06745 [Rhodocyclaceae bacterium]|nr:hypothetical protein [Rhodocyclaceae bacterium]